MCNKIFWPDYNHSILGIPNSILKHYGIKNEYATLPKLDTALAKNYKNVVLMILDGLGVDMIKHNLHPLSFLRRHIKDKISSVFPPTTTAATSTYYSAKPPVCHGWLAWSPYFKEYDRVIELFRDKDLYTQQKLNIEPVAQQLQYEHIFNKINKANKEVCTTKIFPSFEEGGAETFQEMCDRISSQTQKSGKQFILAYWNEPDHTSHKHNPYSRQVKSAITHINSQVKKMCNTLQDTLVIISADHGQIKIGETVYINDYDGVVECLKVPLSLDDRVSAIFLKDGYEQKFIKLFNHYFAKDFMLIKSEKALEQNLFGEGTPHVKIKDFLGDYLIISTSNKSLRQHVEGEAEAEELKGSHSGLLAKESIVPLIVIEK